MKKLEIDNAIEINGVVYTKENIHNIIKQKERYEGRLDKIGEKLKSMTEYLKENKIND